MASLDPGTSLELLSEPSCESLGVGWIGETKIVSIYCWSVDIFFLEKISLTKSEQRGNHYSQLGKKKLGLRGSHSFGRFLSKKNQLSFCNQISGPHSTCEKW